MKTIFKKNQIIITALAIMIAVVGYLNFAKDKEDEADREAALLAAGQNGLMDEGDDPDGKEFEDLSAEDLGEDYNFIYGVSDNGDLVLKENLAAQGDNVAASGNGAEDQNKDGAQSGGSSDGKKEDKTDGKTGDKTDGKAEDGTSGITGDKTGGTDGSKEPDKNGAEVTGTPIKDGDASKTDESTPGEAVFTSVTLQNGYFSNAKLNREQMRARSKETLMSVVSDSTVADELKQEAIDTIIALTARAENENAAEILLEAKGYEGVVVSISDTEVDVVVNAESITEQQVAQIEDIVSRKTGITADGIVITTVVMED